MRFKHLAIGVALSILLLTGACNPLYDVEGTARIMGDTPADVASSIVRMQARLPPAKQVEFSQAVSTLTLVTPDKQDARAVGYMTPSFAAMVKGRSADQIIQLATLYRNSVPRDRGGY